jgi:hypothetical protein
MRFALPLFLILMACESSPESGEPCDGAMGTELETCLRSRKDKPIPAQRIEKTPEKKRTAALPRFPSRPMAKLRAEAEQFDADGDEENLERMIQWMVVQRLPPDVREQPPEPQIMFIQNTADFQSWPEHWQDMARDFLASYLETE